MCPVRNERMNVHYCSPIFPRDLSLPAFSAACGILIKSYDIDGMTEILDDVTCPNCMKTTAFKTAAEKISD